MPTVVCPLNGSTDAERALPSALDTARLLGAQLELFSAVEDGHLVARQLEYLDRIVAEHQPVGATEVTTEVVVDPHAPRAIAERSTSSDVFTVMATSSQPLLHTGYIGSAAERTTRSAHNATLLVGPHNTTRLGDVERVVVPCDGSQLSEAILADAGDWSSLLGVDLWVVTSLSPRDTAKSGGDPTLESSYVRRLANQVGAAGWEVLHGSDPAKTIAQWAGDALIAMTTHGRSGLSRIAVGSVTTAVTRWATGPILVANSRRSIAPPG